MESISGFEETFDSIIIPSLFETEDLTFLLSRTIPSISLDFTTSSTVVSNIMESL